MFLVDDPCSRSISDCVIARVSYFYTTHYFYPQLVVVDGSNCYKIVSLIPVCLGIAVDSDGFRGSCPYCERSQPSHPFRNARVHEVCCNFDLGYFTLVNACYVGRFYVVSDFAGYLSDSCRATLSVSCLSHIWVAWYLTDHFPVGTVYYPWSLLCLRLMHL